MKHLQKIHDYWNTRSEGYRLQIEKELFENQQEMYLRYFRAIPQGSSVLDIGCGPGYFSYLLNSLDMDVTAVDYSEGMIEEAKRFISSRTACNVKFYQADAQNLPFAENTFDAIVSRNLVWNLEEPEKAYAEWIRVLKPGGRLFIFDGNHYSYLFYPEFASVQEKVEEKSNHILLGVNTNVLDEIAKELPLSQRIRPDWDKQILESLGAEKIQTEILDWMETSAHKKLPLKFGVFGEKRQEVL